MGLLQDFLEWFAIGKSELATYLIALFPLLFFFGGKNNRKFELRVVWRLNMKNPSQILSIWKNFTVNIQAIFSQMSYLSNHKKYRNKLYTIEKSYFQYDGYQECK